MEANKKMVAEVVREYIRDCHPGGVTLEVVESGIQKIDYWWRVPILPSEEPPHTFEYYDALAGVEENIQEDKNLNILLVPLFPQEKEEFVAAGPDAPPHTSGTSDE
jgi:hypothetical protein